jgi:hypothetical protein
MAARRALTLDRRTQAMGVLALSAALGTAAVELARVWRRGSAELPTETESPTELLEAAGTATLETIAVVREGYAAVSTRENAVFNLLASFTVTFGITRATTALIRSGQGHGVLRDLMIGQKRVHHFVPGIVLALAAGGTSISVRSKQLDRWLALPFGAGAALVLDEAALLLELDDVYWTEEGVLSVQIAFAAIAMLSALAYLIRMLRHAQEQDSEADWEVAAKAWDDLQMSSGGIPGIGL